MEMVILKARLCFNGYEILVLFFGGCNYESYCVNHTFALMFRRKGKFPSKVISLVAQSCPTLCDPMVCSLPGSSVHRILQARVLEWVAIPFSK